MRYFDVYLPGDYNETWVARNKYTLYRKVIKWLLSAIIIEDAGEVLLKKKSTKKHQ